MTTAINAPRISLKVNGQSITSPVAFAAGHTLTETEAAFLNRQVAGAIGNTLGNKHSKAVKAGEPAPTPEALQAEFDAAFAAYNIGVRGAGTSAKPSTDPLSAMVNYLATTKLKAMIIAKGASVRTFQTTKDADGVTAWTKNFNLLIERDGDMFRAQAQAQLDALNNDGSMDLVTPEAAPADATPAPTVNPSTGKVFKSA